MWLLARVRSSLAVGQRHWSLATWAPSWATLIMLACFFKSKGREIEGVTEGLWALLHIPHCEQILLFDCIFDFLNLSFYIVNFSKEETMSFLYDIPPVLLSSVIVSIVSNKFIAESTYLMLLMASGKAHWNVPSCLNRTPMWNKRINCTALTFL